MVAIAADSVEDMANLQAKLPEIRLLTDLKLEASTAFGLHAPGAENPSPGTFVIGKTGVIRWRKLEDSHGDWPSYADVAAAL